MDNNITRELEILITISQNKNVPPYLFHCLFEHRWNLYQSRFCEMASNGVFEIATQTTGLSFYSLTDKGKSRIAELLDQREREIAIRLVHSKQRITVTYTNWKSVIAWVNSVIHFSVPSAKISNSKLQ